MVIKVVKIVFFTVISFILVEGLAYLLKRRNDKYQINENLKRALIISLALLSSDLI